MRDPMGVSRNQLSDFFAISEFLDLVFQRLVLKRIKAFSIDFAVGVSGSLRGCRLEADQAQQE